MLSLWHVLPQLASRSFDKWQEHSNQIWGPTQAHWDWEVRLVLLMMFFFVVAVANHTIVFKADAYLFLIFFFPEQLVFTGKDPLIYHSHTEISTHSSNMCYLKWAHHRRSSTRRTGTLSIVWWCKCLQAASDSSREEWKLISFASLYYRLSTPQRVWKGKISLCWTATLSLLFSICFP